MLPEHSGDCGLATYAMTFSLAALALGAALLHAVWNALVKGASDQAASLALISLGSAAIGLLIVLTQPLPNAAAVPYLLLSAFLHLGYMIFLARAYEVGDLSHVYPIARGISPLLVGAGSFLLVGETLPPQAVFGVLLSSTALLALGGLGVTHVEHPRTVLFYAIGTGLWISAYTVSDALGARVSGNPISFIGWLFVLDIAFFVLMMLRQPARMKRFMAARPAAAGALAGGAISVLAYGMVVYAMSLAPMASISALRETSVIFATLIGTFFLKEHFGRARLPASIMIALGAALITLS